jgi:hypothetical protein
VPVIVLVAFMHRLLQTYAPANVLVRRVRASRPTLRMTVMLGALTFGCALAVRTIHLAIEAGAPGWLNLVVLVLAWDAIKFAVMTCLVSLRCVGSALKGHLAHLGRPVLRVTRRSARGQERVLDSSTAMRGGHVALLTDQRQTVGGLRIPTP